MKQNGSQTKGPWMIVGGYNEILKPHEKWGGKIQFEKSEGRS